MKIAKYKLSFSNVAIFLPFGFLEAEQELGQRLYIDLHFFLKPDSFSCKDDLESVYDYSNVIAHLEKLAKSKVFRLLEDFASQIAELFLSDKRILSLDISIL